MPTKTSSPSPKGSAKRTKAARKGLTVTRHFTRDGADPFADIRFVQRTSKIVNPDGTVVFALDNVEVPDTWDQVSIDILASKYFRKAGVPQADGTVASETSAKQVALRLANAWRHWGLQGGYFASEEDADIYRDEMAWLVINQFGAPNSPQFFNTGLFEAYGIVEDSEGNVYFDPASGEVRDSAHKYERSAASACYILGVNDTLVGDGSIMRHLENEARLFKAGSGSGANLSRIREAGGKLTGGGTSSGLMSFARVHDRGAGAIKSGGTTRRAAKMVIVDADHPDIEEFIWCKVLEERKVAALVAAGYSSDFNGEAYDTVSFQNANHSVRLPAGFLDAVARDDDWDLTSRVDGATVKTLKARELWGKIADAAWQCADPGVQFDDIIEDWNMVADTERLRGTNPCSEFVFVDNSSCNLASLNLVAFWDDESQTFDVESFLHAVRIFTMTLEITVTMSHYPTAEVAVNSYRLRPLGLGYANLGALLMRAGLPYDSDKARAAMGALTAVMHNHAYSTSAEIAAAVGPCDGFAENEGSALRVLRNHRRAAYGSLGASAGLGDYESMSVRPVEIDHLTLAHTPFAALSSTVTATADAAVASAERYGLRNMQVTVLAPTGTIGLLMGCDTTGVEPDFALVKLKKLSGGGYMRIVNGSVEPALRSLGYSEEAVARILTWVLGTQSFAGDTPVNAAALAAAGFTDAEVTAAEAVLAGVSDLTWAFEPHVIGAEAFERFGVGGGTGAALLAAAGFSAADVNSSSKVICGHLTVEGAPDLRDEHLPVFDCAVECGDGTRVIDWSGHVRALGAVAPHLSGSTSKTVNMPNSVSPADVAAAYELAYELGVKCTAIYRDGSKLSQPLNSAKSSDSTDGEESAAAPVLPAQVEGMSPTEYYGDQNPPRFRLPNLRYGPTWRFEVGGEEVYLHAGEYPDGTLGEVFVDWGKQGSTLRGITSALSISLSQGLQHGVPLAKLVDSLRGHTFEPKGVVTGHANVKMAASLTDAIMRVLGHHYLGREDLVQVKGAAVRPHPAAPAAPGPAAAAAAEAAAPAETGPGVVVDPQSGEGTRIFGESCSTCGSSNLMRAGACKVCGDCGTTTGCS